MRKFRLLKAEEIEVKIKQVSEKGAVALIYKTSRVDMDILDETVGAENWQSEYVEIKGNLYCGIGIKDESSQEWVWKYDCGIESRSDGEGNEKKGEASDAFKRAGVQWGIGRELYTSPFIFLNLPTIANQNGKGYKLKNPFARFDVKEIEYDGSNKIAKIVIADEKGNEVYRHPREATSATKKAQAVEKNEEFKRLTKSELISVWKVPNVEKAVEYLEKTVGKSLSEFTASETEDARALLEAQKIKREKALKEQAEDAEIPFAITD